MESSLSLVECSFPPAGIFRFFMVHHLLRLFWRPLLDQIATTHSLPCRRRHAAWLGMQKNPVRVVGVAEQLLPALHGINLSLRGQRCNTATFPGRTRTCGCRNDSRKAPKSTAKHSGKTFTFSWEASDWSPHVEFGAKEEGGFAQRGAERRGASTGEQLPITPDQAWINSFWIGSQLHSSQPPTL